MQRLVIYIIVLVALLGCSQLKNRYRFGYNPDDYMRIYDREYPDLPELVIIQDEPKLMTINYTGDEINAVGTWEMSKDTLYFALEYYIAKRGNGVSIDSLPDNNDYYTAKLKRKRVFLMKKDKLVEIGYILPGDSILTRFDGYEIIYNQFQCR